MSGLPEVEESIAMDKVCLYLTELYARRMKMRQANWIMTGSKEYL